MTLHNRITGWAGRSLQSIFPGFQFGVSPIGVKRNHAREYGWPEELKFEDIYRMYLRHPIANAAVSKTAAKTWQTNPIIRMDEEGSDLNGVEIAIDKHFRRIRLWQQFKEADVRSMVGDYGAIIMRVADGHRMDQPLGKAVGIDKLVEVIPVWQHQIKPVEFDKDEMSITYGQPLVWEFDEKGIQDRHSDRKNDRRFKVHTSRVIILSRDGTIHDRSQLEAPFNALLDAEKITGGGAEGFFKNSKGTPVITTAEGTSLEDVADGMEVDVDEVADEMSKVVKGWASGADSALVLSQMKAEFPNISLENPQPFWDINVNSIAACMQIPVKILIGMQTGERASSEDAEEWARTNESRRANEIDPMIITFISRLVSIGMIASADWWVQWDSLIEDTPDDKLNRADKMATINQKFQDEIFSGNEIRVAGGYSEEPSMPNFGEREDEEEDDDDPSE